MIIHTRRRRLAFLFVLHSFAWGGAAYFYASAQTGERGLVVRGETLIRYDALGEQLAATKAERLGWERRVGQLSGEAIDLDMLDERHRRVLNMAHKNDLVILLNR